MLSYFHHSCLETSQYTHTPIKAQLSCVLPFHCIFYYVTIMTDDLVRQTANVSARKCVDPLRSHNDLIIVILWLIPLIRFLIQRISDSGQVIAKIGLSVPSESYEVGGPIPPTCNWQSAILILLHLSSRFISPHIQLSYPLHDCGQLYFISKCTIPPSLPSSGPDEL